MTFKDAKRSNISVILLSILSVMLILHIGIMVIYTTRNHNRQWLVKRDSMIQQVMNTIHMVNATPQKELHKAIKALDNPNMQVKLTQKKLSCNVVTL